MRRGRGVVYLAVMIDEVFSEQQLRWQCRRGMRELDVLLERYLSEHYATDSAADQQRFRALLTAQDPELQAWLLKGDDHPDVDCRPLVERIRAASGLSQRAAIQTGEPHDK